MVAVSPVTSWLITAAASNTSCMKSWYWRTNAWNPDSFFAAVNRFGPWVLSRCAASPAPRPRSGSTSSSLTTIEASMPYQACDPGPVVVMPTSSLGGVIATQLSMWTPWSRAGPRPYSSWPSPTVAISTLLSSPALEDHVGHELSSLGSSSLERHPTCHRDGGRPSSGVEFAIRGEVPHPHYERLCPTPPPTGGREKLLQEAR